FYTLLVYSAVEQHNLLTDRLFWPLFKMARFLSVPLRTIVPADIEQAKTNGRQPQEAVWTEDCWRWRRRSLLPRSCCAGGEAPRPTRPQGRCRRGSTRRLPRCPSSSASSRNVAGLRNRPPARWAA